MGIDGGKQREHFCIDEKPNFRRSDGGGEIREVLRRENQFRVKGGWGGWPDTGGVFLFGIVGHSIQA